MGKAKQGRALITDGAPDKGKKRSRAGSSRPAEVEYLTATRESLLVRLCLQLSCTYIAQTNMVLTA